MGSNIDMDAWATLGAHEFLVRLLWQHVFANLPEESANAFGAQLEELTRRTWTADPGADTSTLALASLVRERVMNLIDQALADAAADHELRLSGPLE